MEYERHRRVVEHDPTNSGSYARLAEMLLENGQTDDAISAWRRAVFLMPRGPFTTRWKRALEVQTTYARGERPLEQRDVRICPRCEAIVPNAITTCGEVLYLSFANTIAQTEVARSWLVETLIASAILWALGIAFSALPLEWKGTVIIATVLVAGFFSIRAIGGKSL